MTKEPWYWKSWRWGFITCCVRFPGATHGHWELGFFCFPPKRYNTTSCCCCCCCWVMFYATCCEFSVVLVLSSSTSLVCIWREKIPGDSSLSDLFIPDRWRALNFWKGHLTMPKRSQRIARYGLFTSSLEKPQFLGHEFWVLQWLQLQASRVSGWCWTCTLWGSRSLVCIMYWYTWIYT